MRQTHTFKSYSKRAVELMGMACINEYKKNHANALAEHHIPRFTGYDDKGLEQWELVVVLY